LDRVCKSLYSSFQLPSQLAKPIGTTMANHVAVLKDRAPSIFRRLICIKSYVHARELDKTLIAQIAHIDIRLKDGQYYMRGNTNLFSIVLYVPNKGAFVCPTQPYETLFTFTSDMPLLHVCDNNYHQCSQTDEYNKYFGNLTDMTVLVLQNSPNFNTSLIAQSHVWTRDPSVKLNILMYEENDKRVTTQTTCTEAITAVEYFNPLEVPVLSVISVSDVTKKDLFTYTNLQLYIEPTNGFTIRQDPHIAIYFPVMFMKSDKTMISSIMEYSKSGDPANIKWYLLSPGFLMCFETPREFYVTSFASVKICRVSDKASSDSLTSKTHALSAPSSPQLTELHSEEHVCSVSEKDIPDTTPQPTLNVGDTLCISTLPSSMNDDFDLLDPFADEFAM